MYMDTADSQPAELARLDENILLFVRLLRRAGLSVGVTAGLDAVGAVRCVGLASRTHIYHALSSCLVFRPEDSELFDQAFYLFWRNPKFLEKMRNLLLPQMKQTGRAGDDEDMLRRLEEALGQPGRAEDPPAAHTQIHIDARQTASAREQLNHKDFQMMSVDEIAQAEQAVAMLVRKLPMRKSRRMADRPPARRLDFRQSLAGARRRFGLVLPQYQSPAQLIRPLVVLTDISGSMDSYSRMMLHFIHALGTLSPGGVSSFVFGTRLTPVTGLMAGRDVDASLAAVSDAVSDWAGGTDIGTCLADFNQNWSRRVLGQGASVLLMTDGLERGTDADLAFEMQRLQKSCHQLIWLNPLLRFDGFQPKSRSVQTMLAFTDRFLAVHSVHSLGQLAQLLATGDARPDKQIQSWKQRARYFSLARSDNR